MTNRLVIKAHHLPHLHLSLTSRSSCKSTVAVGTRKHAIKIVFYNFLGVAGCFTAVQVQGQQAAEEVGGGAPSYLTISQCPPSTPRPSTRPHLNSC